MTGIITTAFPSSRGAAYKACKLIIDCGPQTVEQLFVAVDFGADNTKKAKIAAALQAGWLFETPAGTIDVTDSVRAHFASLAPKQKFIGQVAPPAYRGNWRNGTLRKDLIPRRHGLRPASDAAPDWSVRETVAIVTIGRSEP